MNSKRLLISLCPGVLFGMLLQNQIDSKLSETKENAEVVVLDPSTSSSEVSSACNAYQQEMMASQKVYGAILSKESANMIVDGAIQNVYLRIGSVSGKMTLYFGNDNNVYMKPDGYCPNICPFD